ncbi:MAG: HPF/RaiA family ribosome-associated protein [Myxococcales bacterium]|nr:HPF/RaiA family ribosome-associated protein [Myxococcales bacterium]
MDLVTTFRGLDRNQSGVANRAIERASSKVDRLLDGPTTLRVVVDNADGPEVRVILSMTMRGSDLTSDASGHDINAVVAGAFDKLRSQLVRVRHRRESQRHKAVARVG